MRRVTIQSVGGLTGLLLALLLLAGCARMPVAEHLAQFPGEVVEKPASIPLLSGARSNIVTVLAFDEKGRPVGLGSGFYIRSNQVVTCLHVIEHAHSLRIELADGTQQAVAGIFGTDSLMDSAVLWTTNPPPVPVNLRLRESPVELFEPVYVLGAPKRLAMVAAKGEVTQVLETGTEFVNSAFALSAPILPGFSGGPILDVHGLVVGVTVAMQLSSVEHVSIGLPVQELVELGAATPVSFSDWRKRNPRLNPQASLAVLRGDLLTLRNSPEALKEYDRALTLSTNLTRAWVRRGVCLMALKRNAEALRSFQTALRLEPGLILPRVYYAFCLEREKRFVEAKQEAEAVLARRPNSAAAHFALAVVHISEEDHGAALEAARRAGQLRKWDVSSEKVMGEVWNLAGVPAEAEKCFYRAHQLQPTNSSIWLSIGGAQMELKRDLEAVASLHGVLLGNRLEPKPAARYLIYAIAFRNHEAEAAKKQFAAFLTEEAMLLRRTGAPATVLKRITDLKNRDWNSAPAQLELADLFAISQRPREALVALETHALLSPNDAEAWLQLARSYSVRWRFEQSRDAALKAIALKADLAKSYQTLGSALCALGELNEARVAFDKALDADQASVANHLGLACVEARAGNSAKARQHLEEAKKWDKSFPVQFESAPERILPDARTVRRLVGQ